MVTRIGLVVFVLLNLTACGLFPVRTVTEVQYQKVPLLYCPAPNWDLLQRPELAINNMTPEQRKNPGEVAKRYKASIKQLQNHVEILELQLKEYDKNNTEYDELRKQFIEIWETFKTIPDDEAAN